MTLRIRRETLHWHQGAEFLKICHLSDLHLKWNRCIPRLRQIEQYLQQEQPDLIAMTGDYSDTPNGAILARRFIAQLSHTYPVCWIHGNHDYWYGPDLLHPLRQLPHCHHIDHSPYYHTSSRGLHYQIVSWQQHQQHPIPANFHRIILIHNPEILRFAEQSSVESTSPPRQQLILAGHLHGGQFIFWKTKTTRQYPGGLLYRRCVERQTFGQQMRSTLIVSTGLGDTVPLRFRCPYEIVSITIH